MMVVALFRKAPWLYWQLCQCQAVFMCNKQAGGQAVASATWPCNAQRAGNYRCMLCCCLCLLRRFLSKLRPVFFLRPRDYSKSVAVAPFIINYSGALFREYPGPWQVCR